MKKPSYHPFSLQILWLFLLSSPLQASPTPHARPWTTLLIGVCCLTAHMTKSDAHFVQHSDGDIGERYDMADYLGMEEPFTDLHRWEGQDESRFLHTENEPLPPFTHPHAPENGILPALDFDAVKPQDPPRRKLRRLLQSPTSSPSTMPSVETPLGLTENPMHSTLMMSEPFPTFLRNSTEVPYPPTSDEGYTSMQIAIFYFVGSLGGLLGISLCLFYRQQEKEKKQVRMQIQTVQGRTLGVYRHETFLM